MGNTLSNRPEVQVAGHYRPVLTACPYHPPDQSFRPVSPTPSYPPRSPPLYPRGPYRPPAAPLYPTPSGLRSPRISAVGGGFAMASPGPPGRGFVPNLTPNPGYARPPPFQPQHEPAASRPPYQIPAHPLPQQQHPPRTGGYERYAGDSFLDACFCRKECQCREGVRVLYRTRRADGSAGEGEIRYALKSDVGRGCGHDDDDRDEGSRGRRKGKRSEGEKCRDRVEKVEKKMGRKLDRMEEGMKGGFESLRRDLSRKERRGDRLGVPGMAPFGAGSGGMGEPYMNPAMGGGFPADAYPMGGAYPADPYEGIGGYADFDSVDDGFGDGPRAMGRRGSGSTPFGMPGRGRRPSGMNDPRRSMNPYDGFDGMGYESQNPRSAAFAHRGRGGGDGRRGGGGGRPRGPRRPGGGRKPAGYRDEGEGVEGEELQWDDGDPEWGSEDSPRDHARNDEDGWRREGRGQRGGRPAGWGRQASHLSRGGAEKRGGEQRGAKAPYNARMESVQDQEYGGKTV